MFEWFFFLQIKTKTHVHEAVLNPCINKPKQREQKTSTATKQKQQRMTVRSLSILFVMFLLH